MLKQTLVYFKAVVLFLFPFNSVVCGVPFSHNILLNNLDRENKQLFGSISEDRFALTVIAKKFKFLYFNI